MTTGGPILTAAQMRAAEQAAFDTGVDDYGLMETAGATTAEIIWRAGHKRDTLILCGPGNNGGDGFVIARILRDRGVPVRVAALGESRTPSGLRARAAWGGPVEDMMTAAAATQLVDALFGTGLTRGLDSTVAARLCMLAAGATYSHAIDLPSGVETDSGALLSPVPHFGTCIALGAWKPAHLLQPAARHMGRLVLADIGIAVPSAVHRLGAPVLEAPGAEAHKYTRGLVAVVAGEMAGAACLSAEAAARSGAGYVRLIADPPVPALSHAIVLSPSLDFNRAKAILVGPGLGRDFSAWERLAAAASANIPFVADADALWLFAEMGFGDLPSPAIVTPHEGEFDHMFGDDVGNKIDRALAAAARSGSVIIFKGADSVIAAPDGRAAVASGASPWLSTAGTGDVLAGLAAGRLAVTGDPFRAACEAVWLHGEAARRAGPAFVADDLLRMLPAAIAARL
jgi:hydroxyethylthiazole kinase-like uncharacterized protein yjeF